MDALKADAERMNGIGINLATATVKMCWARCMCCEAGRRMRARREMEKRMRETRSGIGKCCSKGDRRAMGETYGAGRVWIGKEEETGQVILL